MGESSTYYLDHLNLTYIIVSYSVKHGTDGWIESSVEAAEQWKVTALGLLITTL